VLVVDASVLAVAIADDGQDGDHARARLRGERLAAPELLDLEVTSVLRRRIHAGAIDARRAALAFADLAAMPVQRAAHRHLIARCWELRDSAPSPARRAEGEELARRFFEAAAGGDMDALLGMLAPDVVLHGDGGGKAGAIVEPLAGRQRVIRLLVGLLRRVRDLGVSIRLAWVNGQPGAVFYDAEGRVVSVVELDIADGVVQTIRSVVNPDKLGHIGPGSDVARLPRRE